VACERQVRHLSVPSMLIQPLLENAVKYGADTSPRPLRVDVRVCLRDQMLHIEVANTGQWVRPGSGNGSGLGLRALRKRLEMLYGDAASVSSRDGHGWVRVEVAMPAVPGPQPFPGSRSRVAPRCETVAAASPANGVVTR
jgi:LytS/YehU family sensor histidine kinase